CGGESFAAWKGCLDDLVARGLRAPVLCIIDGNAGLRRAVGLVWPRAAIQRCCVHKLRNLERKAPKHALAEIRDDFHRIVYAANADTARMAYGAFERTWAKRCPGVVTSLREGGDELLTFFTFPKAQWKTLRTTNVIERLHEEFRRRVKTQGSLPTEDAALVLLCGLVAPPLAAEAQQATRVARIGYLAVNLTASPHLLEAFRQGLRELGYVEGHNVVIEYRSSDGNPERLPALAAELVALKVDVIVSGTLLAVLSAKQATRTIPIVFTVAADPIASGLVTSLARPGGNVTGLSALAPEL